MGRPISEWSLVPAENVFPPIDGGWPEGMQRSDVNDSNRDNLANIRLWYDAPEWLNLFYINDVQASFVTLSATQFTLTSVGVDFTSKFNVGRILRIIDGVSAGVDLRTIVESASFSNDVTTVNIAPGRPMTVSASDVLVYFSAELSIEGFAAGGGPFYEPATATSEGINAAIQLANAAGGGIVFMKEGLYTIADILVMEDNVSLLGVGEGTILRQNDATDLAVMLDFNGDSGSYCRDFVIDVNRFNQTTNVANGISITTCSNLLFDNVLVKGSGVGIVIDVTASTDIEIRSCRFEDYTDQGISARFITGNHTGTISDCFFATTEYRNLLASAIFVWGHWNIGNNRIDLTGTATVDNRGIYLQAKTGADNGGNKCTVTGNTITSSCDNTTAIEVGGNDCTVTGNSIVLTGTVTKGIVVDTATGGLFIDRVAITGNTIDGATSVGLQLSGNARYNTVSGNTITASLLAMDVTGTLNLINGNTFVGGTDGIRFNAASILNAFNGNSLRGIVATAIDVFSGATENDIRDNIITGSPVDFIVDAGTGTKLWANSGDIRREHTQLQTDYEIPRAAQFLTPIPEFQALPIAGGGANGFRTIFIEINFEFQTGLPLGQGCEFFAHVGDNGDETDTVVRGWDVIFDGTEGIEHLVWEIPLPASSTGKLLTISTQNSGSITVDPTLRGGNTYSGNESHISYVDTVHEEP